MNNKLRQKLVGWLVFIPLIALAGGVWFYVRDDARLNQQWFEEDQIWNDSILSELADIKGQLAMVEYNLTQTIDRHEEFVSGEHVDLLRSIATSQDDLNFRIGALTGGLLEKERECTQ